MSGGFDPNAFDNSSGTGGFYTIAAAVNDLITKAYSITTSVTRALTALSGNITKPQTNGTEITS
jgi:hypothetical protein